METEELKVTVEKLQLGMYVSRLDRPWLDSPFPFQGFLLDEVELLEQVKDCCKYVFIDTEKSGDSQPIETSHSTSMPLSATIELDDDDRLIAPQNQYTEQATKSKRRFREWPPQAQAGDGNALCSTEATEYQDQHDTEEEMVQAQEALSNFQAVIEQTFESIRSGGQIDPEQIDRALGAILASMARNPDALIWLARLGNPSEYTFRHCINMSIWAISLGRQIGLPPKDLRLLGKGAVFCDLGKAEIPSELLMRDGPLMAWETDVVRQHVESSLAIAEKVGDLDPAILAMVAQHHECHDGTGYPFCLEKEQIDLYGRIAGIADCFDAMINTRPYRQGVPISAAIREMYNLRGTRFQKELMEEFIHAIGLYPAGTLVELSTGQVGVVIGESRVRRLRPRIMLLLDSDKVALDHFPVVDLISEEVDADGYILNIMRDLEPGAYDLDPAQYFLA